jgi:ubiquinone/menaquinone biosynthesis C-methylase UbiE
MEASEIKKALEDNAQTPNYNRWIFESFRDFLGNCILEVGSGIGNITGYIAEDTERQVILVDIMDEFTSVLKSKYSSNKNVKIFKCDVLDKEFINLVSDFRIDTVLCINVLEHLWDDLKALRQMKKVMRSGAQLIILAPAFKFLYSRWDKAIGHYKRYTRKELMQLLDSAGFKVKKAYYMNFIGFFGWLINAKILNFSPGSSKSIIRQAVLFDRYVNILSRMEHAFHPPFGLSVFAVCSVT